MRRVSTVTLFLFFSVQGTFFGICRASYNAVNAPVFVTTALDSWLDHLSITNGALDAVRRGMLFLHTMSRVD